MSSKKVKGFLLGLAVLCSGAVSAQLHIFPLPEGSPYINRQIYIGQFKIGLGVPLFPDTATATSHLPDSLGWVIQIRATGLWYKRDTIPGGGHFWNQVSAGSGSPGAWGSITGLLTAQTDLYDSIQARQRALGFTPIAPADTGTMLSAYLRLAAAQASFYPLTGNPSGFLTSNGLPAVVNFLQVINAGGADSWAAGLYAGRPAPGTPRRFYLATDSATIYYDNGSTWLKISNGSGGGGGGTISWGAITGTLSSQTDLGNALNLRLLATANLSDLNNAGTARTNLGLGNVQNVDQTNASNLASGTVPTARLDTISLLSSKANAQKKADSLGILIGKKQNDLAILPITLFGAVGDSSTDNSAAINNAIAAIAAGSKKGAIYIPAGVFKIVSTIHIPPSVQISIIGAGGSVGAIENSVSKIVYSFTTGDAIVDSGDNSTIKGFDLQNNASSPSAGSGLHLVGRFARISDMSIIGNYNNVVLDNSYYDRITNVSFIDAVHYDLLNQNTALPDFGDLTVSDCYFLTGYSANTHATTVGIFQPNSGGIKVVNSKWNSGTPKMVTCIQGIFSGSGNATSDLALSNNSFENYTGAAIDLAVPTSNFSNITITGGNISSNNSATGIRLRGATGGLHRITVTGVSMSALDTAIAAYNVDHLSIAGNDIDSPATVTVGVVLSSCTNTFYDRNMVVNYNGVLFLGSGAYSAKPAAAAGPGLYYATDSSRMMFTNGTTWSFITDKANQVFHLYIKRKGAPGDSAMISATDSTVWVAALRDSLGFHHVFNPDGSVTMWSTGGGSGDTTNLSFRSDTLAADIATTMDSVLLILAKTDKHTYFNNDQAVAGVDTFMYALKDTSLHHRGQLVESTDASVSVDKSASNQQTVVYNFSIVPTLADSTASLRTAIATAAAARVLNQSNAGYLGAGAYASRPAAASGTGLWWATDSLAFWYSNGSIWTKASNNVGYSSVTLTSPNHTVTIGGTPSLPTLDLNLAANNVWTATQQAPEFDITPSASASPMQIYDYAMALHQAGIMFHPGGSIGAGSSISLAPRSPGFSGNEANLTLFGTDYSADNTNYEYLQLTATGTDYELTSGKNGSGSYRPINIGFAGFPLISMATNLNIGFDNQFPAYNYDFYTSTSPAIMHLAPAQTDDGGYWLSLAGGKTYLSGGESFTGTFGSWTAKAATASIAAVENGGFNIYGDNGLTIGATFTPTQLFGMAPSGQLQLNKYGAGSFTGTVAHWLGETSTGQIVEGTPPTGAYDSIIMASHYDVDTAKVNLRVSYQSGMYLPAGNPHSQNINTTSYTIDSCSWIKVGHIVHVQGVLSNVVPTSAGITTEITLAPPLPYPFTGHNFWGTVALNAAQYPGAIYSNPYNDAVIWFIASGTGPYAVYYQYQYETY